MSSNEKSGDDTAPSDDLDQLARQYLDLWQDQLTALSANPAVSEAMAGFFAKWSPAATSGGSDQKDGRPDDRGPDKSGQAAGTAAAGTPSVAGGDRIGELLDRLDRIEERLARLEKQRS